MRRLSTLSCAALLLAMSQLVFSSELCAAGMTLGTSEEWLERCELGEHYARADSVGDDPKMAVPEIVEANLCLGFLSGFQVGFLMSEAKPLIERYGDDPPAEAMNKLDLTICVLDPYDEVVGQLVGYLRDEAVDPEAEFPRVLFDFYLEHYPCEEQAPHSDPEANPDQEPR